MREDTNLILGKTYVSSFLPFPTRAFLEEICHRPGGRCLFLVYEILLPYQLLVED